MEVNKDHIQLVSNSKQLSDETIRNLITPESICQYESALFGEAQLRQLGIEKITNAEKISRASNKYCTEQREVLRQKISKFIENEVLCTPWNLSSNFCEYNPRGGMLMIDGLGDPSKENGGYSFLKLPLKISNDCYKDCVRIRQELNPAMQNPKSVTGTDADLRKLKKEEVIEMLQEVGYDLEQLKTLSRWDMVGILRDYSSQNQHISGDNKNRIYARGIRHTAKKQKNVYHEQVDKFFKKQMQYLTHDRTYHDDSDHEDPADKIDVPALSTWAVQNYDDGSGDEAFTDPDQRRFIVEVSDADNFQELEESSTHRDEHFNPFTEVKSGNIHKIHQIPGFKKLIIAVKSVQTQNSS